MPIHSYKSRSWLHDFHLSAEVPLRFKVRIAYLLSLSHSATCILQEDRDSSSTEQAKLLARVCTLEMGRMVLCPQGKEEEETCHKCCLWDAMAEFRGKKVQPCASPSKRLLGRKALSCGTWVDEVTLLQLPQVTGQKSWMKFQVILLSGSQVRALGVSDCWLSQCFV